MHAYPAQPSACKRSVLTQEIIRRLVNSSIKLNWEKETAPVITEIMARKKKIGIKKKTTERGS